MAELFMEATSPRESGGAMEKSSPSDKVVSRISKWHYLKLRAVTGFASSG